MAFSLGGLGVAASRALAGYGQGRLQGQIMQSEEAEREQARREQYAQRLHEIMLAHALTRGSSAQVPLGEFSPALNDEVKRLLPGTDYGQIPEGPAMALALARIGQQATSTRETTSRGASQGFTEHEQLRTRATQYAQDYAANHSPEISQSPGMVVGQIWVKLGTVYPQLTPAERTEIAQSAIETYKHPKPSFAQELLEGLKGQNLLPDSTAAPP